ncbi:hypothetical protein QYE76_065139 [Lolium multiflorum]|uniref:Uncharacterized protein n=1 Tax=Lolium multiflorum TaxID=4521 RepID=A0AAD8S8T1_LOLMU|nr:hypothetical protein QYE76_065139 [Lolium multiflorum]
MPDTGLDEMVHHTRQAVHAQTCPDAHAHARARMARATDPPGHVVARAAPLTSASSLCATSSATSPATRWTTPLARGNPVHDATVDVLRRGTASFGHALVLVSPSLSPQSGPADRTDVAHTRASTPGHQPPQSVPVNLITGAAAVLRRAPSIQATPGDATATRRFLVVDNVAAHPSDDRRSSDVLSDPYLRRP